MASTDVAQTEGRRCDDCGHPAEVECDCACCLTDDEEFAVMLDTLAAAALIDGNHEDAGYLWDAADWHAIPTETTVSARLMLLSAAVARGSR
jgi:hypothetical protein